MIAYHYGRSVDYLSWAIASRPQRKRLRGGPGKDRNAGLQKIKKQWERTEEVIENKACYFSFSCKTNWFLTAKNHNLRKNNEN